MSGRVLASAGLLALLALSGLSVALPAAHAVETVDVSIYQGASYPSTGTPGYSPDKITIVIGVNNTVLWIDNDSAKAHTVTSSTVPTGAKQFNSPNLQLGDTFSYTFTVPGTYYYYCIYHSWMTGEIIVKASSAPSPEFPTSALAFTLLAVLTAVMVVAPRLKPPTSIKT